MNVAVKTAGNYKTLRWLSRRGSLRRLSKAVLEILAEEMKKAS
jgi:hypothetical protein